MEIEIVVANYRASNAQSYLAYLDKLSERRRDGGLIHGGHIHYIQSRFGGIILKAAIKEVLDRVPDTFPLDLPEQVEKPGFEPTEEIINAIRSINKTLIVPLQGYDVVRIIELAREYAQLDAGEEIM